jgi:hypothetical protein
LFPRFHLEINKADRDPFATKREQRSLFFPKSARLLKLLLQRNASWKVADLAQAAKVSLGQVSNVRRALMEREWAQTATGEGLHLTQPNALLDAWRDGGLHAPSVALRGYTLKHGRALDEAIEAAFSDSTLTGDSRILLASHSVARRAAPYARVAGEYFYATEGGQRLLERHLDISPADKGENITIYRPGDEGLWMETMPLRAPLHGTGPIQTYLDLLTTGERGREAAEHWRTEKIKPLLSGAA